MPSTFSIQRRVEFSETDMAGIVHYSNYFRYMESCEQAFFRSMGTSVVDSNHRVGWPRVHASCDFKKPLQFEDEVEVTLHVTEKKQKSLSYQFTFKKSGEVIARGRITAVCVTRDEQGRMKSIDIPAAIANQIETTSLETLP
ncbi:MAG: acyl-CoA thioesterase [Pedosphaera sp.]|nr:acyl-CoA thioesterase [Pedosphaera sp.]